MSTPELLEFYDSFADKADNTTLAGVTSDSGFTYTVSQTDSTATPRVASGSYVIDSTENQSAAGYLNATLSATATYLEADFTFGSAGTTSGGAAALVAFDGTADVSQNIPCHLVCGESYYQFGVWADGVYTVIGTWFYPTGSVWSQHVEVALDSTSGVAYVRGADGSVQSYASAAISTFVNAPYVCAEVYYTNASTDNRVSFQGWGASSVALEGHYLVPTQGESLKKDTRMAGLVDQANVFEHVLNINTDVTLQPGIYSTVAFYATADATVTLPTILGSAKGARISVKNVSTYQLTVACQGADTIYTTDYVASTVLAGGGSVTLVNDGYHWLQV